MSAFEARNVLWGGPMGCDLSRTCTLVTDPCTLMTCLPTPTYCLVRSCGLVSIRAGQLVDVAGDPKLLEELRSELETLQRTVEAHQQHMRVAQRGALFNRDQ